MTDLAAAMYRARITPPGRPGPEEQPQPKPRAALPDRTKPHGFETWAQRRAALDDPVLEPVRRPKTIEIKRAVAEFYSVEIIDLDSRRRDECIIRPRHVAAYLACKLTDLSLVEIGRRLGGRDHSTIVSSRNNIQKKLLSDVQLANDVKELTKILEPK